MPQSNNPDRPAQPKSDLQKITEPEEKLANDLANQASYQASPLTDDRARALEPESETAERAERAAGLDPHKHHLEDSERAFTQSRGSDEARTPGYLREKE